MLSRNLLAMRLLFGSRIKSRSSGVGRGAGNLIFPFKQQREKNGLVCDEPISFS